MHSACVFKDLEMIEILIKAGFEINKQFRSRPASLMIPLGFTFYHGDDNVLKKLVENGASTELAFRVNFLLS